MRWLAPLLLVAGCATVAPDEVLTMRAEVHVNAPPSEVFAAIADPRDEAPFRREKVAFTADGPLGLGTRFVETISVALVNDYQMETEIKAFEPGRRIRIEATGRQARRFSVERWFLPEAGGTRLVSEIEADVRVVRDTTAGLPLPGWLVRAVFEANMRAALRHIAEALGGKAGPFQSSLSSSATP